MNKSVQACMQNSQNFNRMIETIYESRKKNMDKMFFSQRGGVRLDYANSTWPYAKIAVSSESIILHEFCYIFWKKHVFNRNEIFSLKKYHGFFSQGLQIKHQKKECPQHVVFWTFNFKSLKMALEKNGYPVEES